MNRDSWQRRCWAAATSSFHFLPPLPLSIGKRSGGQRIGKWSPVRGSMQIVTSFHRILGNFRKLACAHPTLHMWLGVDDDDDDGGGRAG